MSEQEEPTAPQRVVRGFAFRGAAQQMIKCKAGEVLLAGPAGTGKSFANLVKLHLMMLANPGARGLILRKTHVSLTETGLVTFKEKVATEAFAAGVVTWYGGSGDKPAGYRYSNGSFVAVGGMDKPMKIMSSEYDVVVVIEATELTLNDIEMVTTRLRNGVISFQQLLMDCNPQKPTHWLKKRCDEGQTLMLHSRHEDNPRIAQADGTLTQYGRDYLAVLDQLTGARKQRLRYGKWAAAEGIIYEGWDPAIHLSDRAPRKGTSNFTDHTRYWVIDFGFTNPFVWQQWAVDPDGRLLLEIEIYHTQRFVERHVEDILREVIYKESWKEMEAEWNKLPDDFRNTQSRTAWIANRARWKYPKPRRIICDHDAEDRATFERHSGRGTVAADKRVSVGIEAVAKRLKVAGDGRPRLEISRAALVERDQSLADRGLPTCTAEEWDGYSWKPKPNTASAEQKPEPDEPIKANDHGMDTTRYVVMEVDQGTRPRVRWM